MLNFIADSTPIIENLTQLGAAGLMGAMWLWERNTSRTRERQIDEAHARILAERPSEIYFRVPRSSSIARERASVPVRIVGSGSTAHFEE